MEDSPYGRSADFATSDHISHQYTWNRLDDVTQKQGNPDWTEEKTILALDIYLSSGRQAINRHDRRVVELSELLQRISWPE
jgi:hypothetical protein